MHDDFEIKPLYIRFLKTSSYIKSYDSQTKWMYILIEDDDLLKILFVITSVLILKKTFIAKLSITIFFVEILW